MAKKKTYKGKEEWEKLAEQLKKHFRPTIPDKPFGDADRVVFTDKGHPPGEKYREVLTPGEIDELKQAVPELTNARLEALLRRVYNLGDHRASKMTWPQIIDFCRDFVESETEIEKGKKAGCIDPKDFKWQKVQKKIKDYWKLLKKEGHKFPSFRGLAKELNENAGTIKKAIEYDLSLTRAYNKDRPAGKKLKRIDPSKLDFVGIKAFHKGGKKDPIYEEQRDNLIAQIKTAARKEARDIDPDVKAYGDIVLRNTSGISQLDIEGLKDLLKDLIEKRSNRMVKMKALFEMNRMR